MSTSLNTWEAFENVGKPGKGLFSLIWREWADQFDAVARGGGQSPGAGLLTGVSVRPVGAAYCARHAVEDMVTARWDTRQATMSEENNDGCVTEEVISSGSTQVPGVGGGGGVFHLNRYDVTHSWTSSTRGRGHAHLPCSRACCRAA